MAVVAVIITAPLGAILTNTLGVIWLNDDSAEENKRKSFRNAPLGESMYGMDVKIKKDMKDMATSTGGLGVWYTNMITGEIVKKVNESDYADDDLDEITPADKGQPN